MDNDSFKILITTTLFAFPLTVRMKAQAIVLRDINK